jgi:hypothetical protein
MVLPAPGPVNAFILISKIGRNFSRFAPAPPASRDELLDFQLKALHCGRRSGRVSRQVNRLDMGNRAEASTRIASLPPAC